MLGLQLIHVGKRGQWWHILIFSNWRPTNHESSTLIPLKIYVQLHSQKPIENEYFNIAFRGRIVKQTPTDRSCLVFSL